MGAIKNLKNVKYDINSPSPTRNGKQSDSKNSSFNLSPTAKMVKQNSVSPRKKKVRNDEMAVFNHFIMGKTDLDDNEKDEIVRQ